MTEKGRVNGKGKSEWETWKEAGMGNQSLDRESEP